MDIVAWILGILVAIIGTIAGIITVLQYFNVEPDTTKRYVVGFLTIVGISAFFAVAVVAVIGLDDVAGWWLGDRQEQSGSLEDSGPPTPTSPEVAGQVAGDSGPPTPTSPEVAEQATGDSGLTTVKPLSGLAPEDLGFAELVDLESGTGTAYSPAYRAVTNDTESLTAEVPSEWELTERGSWQFRSEPPVVGYYVLAARDIDEFVDTWDEPGATLRASSTVQQQYSTDDFLGENDPNDQPMDTSQDCTYVGDDEHEYNNGDENFTLSYRVWNYCSEEPGQEGSTSFMNFVIEPESDEYVVRVTVILVSEADVQAIHRMLETIAVDTSQLGQG